MKQLKLITKLRGLIVLALALVFSGNAWADTVTESVTLHPTGVSSNSNFSNTGNAYAAASNTSNFASITFSQGWGWGSTSVTSGYVYYTFDAPSLPDGATITNVTCTVGAYKSNSSITANAQLYDGTTTAMSSSTTISGTSSGSTTTVSSTGSWTTDNISNAVLRITASYNGNSTRYFYVGGADLTITYTYDATPKAVTGTDKYIDLSTTTKTASPFTTADGYTGTVTYTSSDASVATVDDNGVVTGIKNGNVTITATPAAQDGYTNDPVEVNVIIYASTTPNYKETSWSAGQEVYLLNKATGRYLATGGYWGTEGQLKTTGVPTTLVSALSSTATGASVSTTMTQNSKNWGWVTPKMIATSYKQGLYCDVSDDDTYKTYTHSFTFTNLGNGEFSIATDQMTSYTGSTYYLAWNGDGSETRNYIVTAKTYSTDAIPDEARWFIVTKQNLIDDFANATASNAQPKEATFFINNSDFSREVAKSWTFVQGGSTSLGTNNNGLGSYDDADDEGTGYIRIGNSLFATGSPATTVNGVTTYIEDANTAIGSGTAYTGNGNGYSLQAADLKYVGSDLTEGTSTYYNLPYGGFYNCRILGTSGTVSQSFTVTTAGWYTVSLEGYVYNPSGANGVATFFAGNSTASIGDYYKEVTLDANTFETMTNGGITLYNGGENSDYHQTITVYLAAGDNFVIGVKLAGGTLDNPRLANTCSFAEFDRVRIKYTGNPTYNILLDEKNDGSVTYTSAALSYINAQVYTHEGEESRTLYLKRKMYANQWNSLVLPVKIDAAQLKAAFGDKTLVAEYNKAEGNWIYFKHVELTDGTTVIQPGHCYLVKPSSLDAFETSGTKSVNLARVENTAISATATEASPIVTITQVELTEEVNQNPSKEPTSPFKPTTDNDDLSTNYKGLQWMGTYFQQGTPGVANDDGVIGYGSYAINAATGKWNRYTGSSYIGVDGFRCWIGSVEKDSGDNPAKLITVIDGEELYPTDIEGVYSEEPETITDNRVFNINGQFVGTSENINKLPKGIYISNGKKYIVK